MDEAALVRLLDDGARGRRCTPTTRVAELRRLPFADLGFARSTTTGRSARGCPRPSTARARRPSSARPSSPSCSTAAPRPVLLTRATDEQAAAALAAQPRRGRATATTVVWRPAAPRPERVVVVTAGTADLPVADECAAALAAHGLEPDPPHRRRRGRRAPPARRRPTPSPTPTRSSSSPGWRARWPAWSAASPPAPVVAVPTSVGYGAGLEGVTALLAMLVVVRRRAHRRRHRQRLRRRLRASCGLLK